MTEVTFDFSIVDYTEILLRYLRSVSDKYNNAIIFNPSIAHIRGTMYLCAFRAFKRANFARVQINTRTHQNGNYQEVVINSDLDPAEHAKPGIYNKYHPWYGGPSTRERPNPYWWQHHSDGYDATIILVLNIIHNNVYVNRAYKEFIIPDRVDARLMNCCTDTNQGQGAFVCYYNVYTRDPGIVVKDGKNCGEEGCGLLGASLIKLSGNQIVRVDNEVILCPEISGTVEKNWSTWIYRNTIYFSYGLYPNHDVYTLNIIDNKLVCRSGESVRGDSPFNRFTRYYGNDPKISTSAPALKINDQRYIGIGHIKYVTAGAREPDGTYPPNSELLKFHRSMSQSATSEHPILTYMMYFYEFNPRTAKVLSVSKMFIPKSTRMLAFPAGLCYTRDGKIMVSYGDNDNKCKYMSLTLADIYYYLMDKSMDRNGQVSPKLPFVEIIPDRGGPMAMTIDTP